MCGLGWQNRQPARLKGCQPALLLIRNLDYEKKCLLSKNKCGLGWQNRQAARLKRHQPALLLIRNPDYEKKCLLSENMCGLDGKIDRQPD